MPDPACPSFPVELEPGRNVLRGDGCDLDGVVVRSGTTKVTLHAGRPPQALSTDLGSMTVVRVSSDEAVVDVVVEGRPPAPGQHTIVLHAPRTPFDRIDDEMPGFGLVAVLAVALGIGSMVYRLRRRDG